MYKRIDMCKETVRNLIVSVGAVIILTIIFQEWPFATKQRKNFTSNMLISPIIEMNLNCCTTTTWLDPSGFDYGILTTNFSLPTRFEVELVSDNMVFVCKDIHGLSSFSKHEIITRFSLFVFVHINVWREEIAWFVYCVAVSIE